MKRFLLNRNALRIGQKCDRIGIDISAKRTEQVTLHEFSNQAIEVRADKTL